MPEPRHPIKQYELLDSEVLKIGTVMAELQKKRHRAVNIEGFRKEAIERFAEAGFEINFMIHDGMDGQLIPEIEIVGRTEDKKFDFDQMVREVTADIANTGQSGVINTKGGFSGLILPGSHKH